MVYYLCGSLRHVLSLAECPATVAYTVNTTTSARMLRVFIVTTLVYVELLLPMSKY